MKPGYTFEMVLSFALKQKKGEAMNARLEKKRCNEVFGYFGLSFLEGSQSVQNFQSVDVQNANLV